MSNDHRMKSDVRRREPERRRWTAADDRRARFVVEVEDDEPVGEGA